MLKLLRSPRLRPLRLRRYRRQDALACHALYRRTVLEATHRHYGAAQRRAWAGPAAMPAAWPARLEGQITWVAPRRGGVAGFLTLGDDGHIDFLYVAPEAMGTGLADRLYAAALAEARRSGLTRLTTEASHFARAFFTRHGWQTDARQSVIRDSVAIENFRMSKEIG